MDFSTRLHAACFLVDNGSLEPAATLELRRLARALTNRLGRPVEPVSLLHSNRVASHLLGSRQAEVFDAAIRARHAAGVTEFLVIPLFFGLSGALTEYLPGHVRRLADELGPLSVQVAAPVAGDDASAPDERLARILSDHVTASMRAHGLASPAVVLVDHGSPQPDVTRVRDRLARQLAERRHGDVRTVVPASMERRAGREYDFNEPLLERALVEQATKGGAGDVVVAPLFFSPGRHAGPGGDIETIARGVAAKHPSVRVHFTALVGKHPLLIDILADRLRAMPAAT